MRLSNATARGSAPDAHGRRRELDDGLGAVRSRGRSSRSRAGGRLRPRGLVLVGIVQLVVSCTSPAPPGADHGLGPATPLAPTRADIAYARTQLGDAREFLGQDRVEAALRATNRGLSVDATSAALHRLQALLLARLGRESEARAAIARADEIEPPPPPLPRSPHPLASPDLLVVLLPPPAMSPADRDHVPVAWPRGPAAAALEARLRTRLPGARVIHAAPDAASAAVSLLTASGRGAVLSLRVDRSYFASTRKDGTFSVAWLRAAAATPGATLPAVLEVHYVLDALVAADDVREEALARALEAALDDPRLAEGLAKPPHGASGADRPASASGAWSPAVMRDLFPAIAERRERERAAGRRMLAVDELAQAADHFARAVEIDPGDRDARAELAETRASLALARALELRAERSPPSARTAANAGRDALIPGLSDAQRSALEAQLRDQQDRRRSLLAALEILDGSERAPSPVTLAALTPGLADQPDAAGRVLVRSRHASEPEVRALHAPDGSLIARFYFSPERDAGGALRAESLWLREDDSDGDGRPDRWTAYEAGVRTDSWEDRSGSGRPDRRLRYDGGARLPTRLEIDRDEDGRPERSLGYRDGRLHEEARDEDADGRFDVFERFAESGDLILRAEDRDADGQIDVRTHFEAGRVVRREWLTPNGEP